MVQFRDDYQINTGDLHGGSTYLKPKVIQENQGSIMHSEAEYREPDQINRFTSIQERYNDADQNSKEAYVNLHHIGRMREKYSNPDRFEDNVADIDGDISIESASKTKTVKFSITKMFKRK